MRAEADEALQDNLHQQNLQREHEEQVRAAEDVVNSLTSVMRIQQAQLEYIAQQRDENHDAHHKMLRISAFSQSLSTQDLAHESVANRC